MKKYIHQEDYILESGQAIQNLEIAYDTFGQLNAKRDNIIWVFHAISGHSNVLEWWSELFGESKLFDPSEYFIICANTIGSPFGSTKPKDFEFPNFTVRDVSNIHAQLAKALGINKIHTAIGGSFGGYQALEFTYSFKGSIDHLILLACSAKESAWGIAIHESQRMAMKADSTLGKEKGGLEGMKAARAIAMLTYRTSEDLINKQTDSENQLDNFKASSYINYHGEKFSKSFDSLCYFYLTKCIDSHNIGRGRGGQVKALSKISTPTLVIGFSSDTLVPVRFQKFISEHIPAAKFVEFESIFGHDGFLKETDKISTSIKQFYSHINIDKSASKRTILKFGGTSLYGQKQLENVLEIIKNTYKTDSVALVVSARGKSTDKLIDLYKSAKSGQNYDAQLEGFKEYLKKDFAEINLHPEIDELENVLNAVALLKDDSSWSYDRILAFGEILSAKCITSWLCAHGLKALYIDARQLIYTEKLLNEFEVNIDKSRSATRKVLMNIEHDVIPVITGFIGSSESLRTVTLGRNGSNYSASLIASFINAKEVQNWTDVNGIFSSNPKIVSNAVKINSMTYREANEMANFGMNLLHPKTILPLIQSKIPLIIKSTLNSKDPGTRIDQEGGQRGIKAVTTIENAALVTVEGSELSEKIGIDARIFSALRKKKISIKMISQASSERGIGFVISSDNSENAEIVLTEEFTKELKLNQISSIRVNKDIGIVSIIGRHNYALEKAIHTLRINDIWMHLISNSISGEHISLVVDKDKVTKAARLVHDKVFGIIKTMNVFLFGKGQVSTALINQIQSTTKQIIKERKIDFKIIGIADSKKHFVDKNGVGENWQQRLEQGHITHAVNNVIQKIKKTHLDNIIIVDNTSSENISFHYPDFIKSNFDIVASNKKFNSSNLDQYLLLKKLINQKNKHFYYEANVGSGLPIIDLLKSLYNSSDNITKIRGVFSGSLSFILIIFQIRISHFQNN